MDENNELMGYLTEAERQEFEEIKRWEEKPGNTFGIFRNLTLPLAGELRKASPTVIDSIVDSVREILKSLRDYSQNTINTDNILHKISLAAEKEIQVIDGLRAVPVNILDKAARECASFNKYSATLGGGLTGVIGFNGLLLDIPLLYTLLFRAIGEVATCYGYPADTPEEKVFMLKTLELGHITDDESRKNTIGELSALHAAIQGGVSLSQLEITGMLKGIQALFERIGMQYLRRKVLLFMMLIGGVAGAGMNYLIASQVADAACHSYKKRFLIDRATERKNSGTPA